MLLPRVHAIRSFPDQLSMLPALKELCRLYHLLLCLYLLWDYVGYVQSQVTCRAITAFVY